MRRPAARLVRGPGWRLAAVLVGALCPPFSCCSGLVSLSPHHIVVGERETRPKTGQKPGTGTGPQRPDQGEPAGQAAEATRTRLGGKAAR